MTILEEVDEVRSLDKRWRRFSWARIRPGDKLKSVVITDLDKIRQN